MNAVVLVLLASGVGINFGWQPMPDGSPRYEYIVQLEPELAATLAEGQTIPISGEVPDEVRPIGRIRILVGRGELPKQTRTTRFKPFAKAGRPPRPRYKNSTGQQAVPPVGSDAKRYLSQPAAQQGIQDGVQQFFGGSGDQQSNRGTAGRGANNWKSTHDHSHPPANNTERPAASQPSYRGHQAPQSPPPVWPSDRDRNNTFVGNGPSNDFGRYRYPSADDNRWAWPSLPGRTTNDHSRFTGVDNRGADDSFDIINRTASHEQPSQLVPKQHSPWPDNSGSATRQKEGPNFPKTPRHSEPDPYVTKNRRPSAHSDPTALPWIDSSATKTINSDMLYQPADSPLSPITNDNSTTLVGNDSLSADSRRSPDVAGSGWNGREGKEDRREPDPRTDTDDTQPAEPKGVFPLILAWVLLSGSGAGNLWLLWSYRDVRDKYRNLVRNAARKLGRRSRDLDD